MTKSKLLFILCVLFFTGCKCIEKESLVNLNETVIPEYKNYVENDGNLSERERRVRLLRVKTFQRLVEEYSK